MKNTKTFTDATITIKNKCLTFKPINQLLDPTAQVLQDPASSAEKHAQNSCCGKHIDHLRNHHQEHLGHLKVDNKALLKPMRAQLDRNNIRYVHAALVESYKHLTTSAINKPLCKPFHNGDCNFSIFTNGIQKFGLELNGSYA